MTVMDQRPDRFGTIGFVLALLPWLMFFLGGDRFIFIWDGSVSSEPDPKFVLVPLYLVGTSLVALVGIVLTIVERKHSIARVVLSIMGGGLWMLFCAGMLIVLSGDHGLE